MRQLDMSILIKHQQARYAAAKKRKDKSRILDEFCNLTCYQRKHAINILKHRVVGWRERPLGRKKKYKPEDLLMPLKEIWLATNQSCGKRLVAALPLWLPHYESFYGTLNSVIKEHLLSMSSSTLDRILKPLKARYPKRLGGTKPGHLLKHQIPIKTNQWNETRPGYVEGDTVAHCGNSLMGNFIWSITVTDIFSGWTENAAMWNKGAHGAKEQIESIEKRLPFPLLGWDSDGGGEFLNYHLLSYFQDREKPVQFTRSRAYHSGDNAHVEQKNSTHVRQLFGYNRFDNPIAVSLMNDLYRNELSLLHNYFYPAMKLQDKIRIQSKIKKHYDKPQTPYQRLMASENLAQEYKDKLKNQFVELNPFELKVIIEKKMKKIFACFQPKRYVVNHTVEKSKKSSSF
jgi:hypothetical protein